MAAIDLSFLRLKVRSLIAKTVEIKETLDVTDADVVGLQFPEPPAPKILGDYGAPALDTTVTLVTGQNPAGTVSWGPQTARLAINTEITDASETIDPATDIEFWPAEDPDNPDLRIYEFAWINDPGADVDVQVTISKII